MRRDTLSAIPLLAITALITGCAATTPKADLIWPGQPEEPRVAFVGSYSGSGDFKQRSFLDFLFGSALIPEFIKPYGVSSFGDKVYVTITGGPNGVGVVDLKQKKVSFIGDSGREPLRLPMGVAVASDGAIYVSDAQMKKIIVYDQEGSYQRSIGSKAGMLNPVGIAINNELTRLYVVDSREHQVFVFSTHGDFLFKFGKRGSADGEFNYPSNVGIDRRNGTVYIADTLNFRVQAFDKDGKFLRKFGQVGDTPGDFSRPKGIGVDSEGHVYIADAAFNNFQIFDENGQMLLAVGSPGIAPGYFTLPAGLYVDENDRICVADQVNYRVQVFQYLSERWKKEHPEEYNKYLNRREAGK